MPVDIHKEEGFRGRVDLDPSSCRRQVFQQQLPVLRRFAWRWGERGQRPVLRGGGADQAGWQPLPGITFADGDKTSEFAIIDPQWANATQARRSRSA